MFWGCFSYEVIPLIVYTNYPSDQTGQPIPDKELL